MSIQVYLNGVISGPDDAKISVFDRGFLYGDSVYEVMRTSGGQPVDLERHLGRLDRSAQSLALATVSHESIRSALRETLEAAGNVESYIRIVVTRGAGEVGLDIALADEQSLLIIVKPMTLPEDSLYLRGAAVQIVEVQRTSARAVDPSVKSGNYLNNIMALVEARKKGAYEAIMCDRAGWLAEGSSSNIFVVKDGGIRTPSLAIGLLAGITRERVLELSDEEGIPVEEGQLAPIELRDADEAFLTSSIRGILPIGKVDGVELSQSAPGPVTRRLMEAYGSFLAEEATRTPLS